MRDPRSHLYRDIHKAIRLLLAELSTLVGSTDFRSVTELATLRARVRRDFGLLRSHAEHEDHFVMPLLALHCPDIATHLADAHEDQHDAMPRLEAQLAAIQPDSEDALARADAFRAALSRYTAEQLAHMADEEELAMQALYGVLDDAQLVGVHNALVQSVPPAEMGVWMAFMLPAMPAPDRAAMLAGLRAEAPPAVFAQTLDLARAVLACTAFEDLSRRLREQRAA